MVSRRRALRAGRCADGSPQASGIFLQVLRLVALVGMAAFASSSLAENNPARPSQQNPPSRSQEAPPAEFQEHGPGMDPFNGVLTPQRIATEIEADAKKNQDPNDFDTHYFMYFADNASEYAALAHYSLLILTVVTQEAQDLPIKNLYIRASGQRIPLARISRWRVDVDPRLATHKIYGPYREDAFYLFPTGALFRPGQVQADLGAGRTGFPVLEMPPQWVPDYVRRFPRDEPPQGAMPSLRALQNLIRRNTAGFPIPDTLPPAAELKPPAAELKLPPSDPKPPVAEPKTQATEPKKPSSLRDLFKGQ